MTIQRLFRSMKTVNYLDLMKAKAKDVYWLLVNKTHTNSHAGPKRWEKSTTSENICWNHIFQSIRETSKEIKLQEFHFKVIHRIFVTKKELFRFKIMEDGDCIYCGEMDSIDHLLINCHFTISFTDKVLQWFNLNNNSSFALTTKEVLFGLMNTSHSLKRKLNYTLLFMNYYIYKRKLQNESLLISDLIKKMMYKYKIEQIK